MSGFVDQTGVTPASLSFLTIYNPSFRTSDELACDQILYYYEKSDGGNNGQRSGFSRGGETEKHEKNRKLREIGLAQATVQFAA